MFTQAGVCLCNFSVPCYGKVTQATLLHGYFNIIYFSFYVCVCRYIQRYVCIFANRILQLIRSFLTTSLFSFGDHLIRLANLMSGISWPTGVARPAVATAAVAVNVAGQCKRRFAVNSREYAFICICIASERRKIWSC